MFVITSRACSVGCLYTAVEGNKPASFGHTLVGTRGHPEYIPGYPPEHIPGYPP